MQNEVLVWVKVSSTTAKNIFKQMLGMVRVVKERQELTAAKQKGRAQELS